MAEKEKKYTEICPGERRITVEKLPPKKEDADKARTEKTDRSDHD